MRSRPLCGSYVHPTPFLSTLLPNKLFEGSLFSFTDNLFFFETGAATADLKKKNPEINFGVSRVDLFLVVYKGRLFILRPFFDPFPRYEIFIFGPKKNCNISETGRKNALK